jgi:hypothetical protein
VLAADRQAERFGGVGLQFLEPAGHAIGVVELVRDGDAVDDGGVGVLGVGVINARQGGQE